MGATVHFCSINFDLFFKDINSTHPRLLANLAEDFKSYIDSGRTQLPNYFGCDVAYIKPDSAYRQGLMHIHLAIPPVSFPKNKPQWDRKCPKNPNTDAALVYTNGLYEEDHYVIIAVLFPGAHAKARRRETMEKLVASARAFRENY